MHADCHDRNARKADHREGEVADFRGSLFLLELPARLFQQMIIGSALVCVIQDFHGTDDEPEVQRSFGIVRTDVGMDALDRLAKGCPEITGVVTGKRSKQIIKRRHGSAAGRGAMARLQMAPFEDHTDAQKTGANEIVRIQYGGNVARNAQHSSVMLFAHLQREEMHGSSIYQGLHVQCCPPG
ncbi:MAG TPA: hypothetical protein VN024_37345 [Bradyrhizobium sp.]|nr:hypothetical protein [Bradyrhizobium sp.]HWX64147.1 hypothetical protein [Bradyrhizobium sp.]